MSPTPSVRPAEREREPDRLRVGVRVGITVGGRVPTRQVYGNTDRPALRLITCGGSFDASSGHYSDYVIVYATATDRRVASGRSG